MSHIYIYQAGRYHLILLLFLMAPSVYAIQHQPEMVDIPGGTFQQGCVSGLECDQDELPVKTVTVKPFSIGKYEVTFDQWDECYRAKGCSHYPDDMGWGRGKRPVINVSYDDIQEYLIWLSKETGKQYWLPTESEWEYASRAGSKTKYWWGNQPPVCNKNMKNGARIDGGEGSACSGVTNGRKQGTAPVGQYKTNAWGLYDVHGNVWEWTADCYTESYKLYAEKNCDKHVLHGGGWSSEGKYVRLANRARAYRDKRSDNFGFRLLHAATNPKINAGTNVSSDAIVTLKSYYKGKIGSSPVSVRLGFNSDRVVTGYYISHKTGREYELKGDNIIDGVLSLREYTNGRYTADLELKKSWRNNRLIWHGKMHNKDGRVVDVTIEKEGLGSTAVAEGIFKKRGFSNKATIALIYSPDLSEAVTEELYKRYGSPGVLVYIRFEPDTGRFIDGMNSVELAKTASDCLKGGRPWADCRLNYHPIDGCYLNNQQRKLCLSGGRQWERSENYEGIDPFGDKGSYCWNYEKGPGIQLPFQKEVKSQINLTNAEIVKAKGDLKEAAKVNATKDDIRSGRNFLNRPVCRSSLANGPSCLSSDGGC